MTEPATCRRWLGRMGATTLICVAFFLAFPNLDLWISGLFGGAQGFAVRDMPGWIFVRAMMIALTDGTVATALAMLVFNLAIPNWRLIRTRVLIFCIAAYAIGPGLIVNGLLKAHSERARPWNVTEFGGDALYSRPFELAGQCTSHCSFVSGEASALTTIAVLVLLIFAPCLPPGIRLRARAAIVAIAPFGSALRVAFGAHFSSDVIFAILFMSLHVTVLYLAFRIHRLPGPFVQRPRTTATASVPI